MQFDFDLARKHCQGIRLLIVLNAGGARNEEVLAKLHARRRAAASFMEDEICHQYLKAVERYGNDLYSDDGHRKWGQLGLSGAAVLRLHLLGELDAYNDRLVELEAGGIARVESGEQPGAKPL